MITVLMCYEDTVEPLNVFTNEGHSSGNLFGAQTSIDKDASFACNYQNRIAG
jgi:hypothetical protein